MKYTITYDKNTRLRVRTGKFTFTETEGYGLAEYLETKEYINTVKTSYRNGSILINYNNRRNRQNILNTLNEIGKEDIKEGKPSIIRLEHEQRNTFFKNLGKIILKRYLIKIFIPIPLRNILTIINAIPHIYKALDDITSFNPNARVLDGTAILFSLKMKDYSSASSTMFILSITNLLHEYTLQKTKTALKDSLKLDVNTVWLVTTNNNQETEISYPISKLQKGDKIKIRQGCIIPIDGKIIKGKAKINESTLTGKLETIEKGKGKFVHAGSIVEEGLITVETISTNTDSQINKIINLINESEDFKGEIELHAEELANSLVPVSFLTTLLTYLITKNTTRALSVMLVDYSCAIELTTPLTILSALREASKNNITIKGGKYLEEYGKANAIVFSKTGTLTNSEPKLVKIIETGKYKRDEILKISACIEEHFTHPIATAIVKQAEKEKIKHEEDHSEVEYILSHGIATKYENKKAIIGSHHFIIEDEKIKITKKQEKIIKNNMGKYSLIYLAIDGKLEGILCIEDPIRKEAKQTIKQLKELGITKIMILSGDSENATKTISEELEITDYKAELSLEEKKEEIKTLKEKGYNVIMVGDGLSDAPALSNANLSIAMKNSPDMVKEIANISLREDNLEGLITLKILSNLMLNKINNNYDKILKTNTSLILLGMFGILSPNTSSIAHNLSTLYFTANSMTNLLEENQSK